MFGVLRLAAAAWVTLIKISENPEVLLLGKVRVFGHLGRRAGNLTTRRLVPIVSEAQGRFGCDADGGCAVARIVIRRTAGENVPNATWARPSGLAQP